MRVVIIVLLLIILGIIAWKAAEQYNLVGAPKETEAPAEETGGAAKPKKAEAVLPSFDIVRVDRTGYAVIAGRGKPDATVTIYANNEELISTVVEADGAWAVTTDTPLDAGPVELSLSMTTEEGLTVRGEETIVIYVPERPDDRPLVLRTTPGGATEVLQTPRDPEGGLGPLSLDVIDYDNSGSVIFSGRAEPRRIVQIFANRQPIGQTTSDENGHWTLSASMAPGVYTLQVIQLDEDGRPAYAIELPFERASPDQIQIVEGKVIVQPGNSLWRISRRAYGRGAQYTIVYEANIDQIRDPDLIYPGQIFVVPEENDEEDQDGK